VGVWGKDVTVGPKGGAQTSRKGGWEQGVFCTSGKEGGGGRPQKTKPNFVGGSYGGGNAGNQGKTGAKKNINVRKARPPNLAATQTGRNGSKKNSAQERAKEKKAGQLTVVTCRGWGVELEQIRRDGGGKPGTNVDRRNSQGRGGDKAYGVVRRFKGPCQFQT